MALQVASREALTADEPRSAPIDPTPPQAPSGSTDAAKPLRPRGRPRKVKAAAEQSAAPPVPSKPIVDDSPPVSTHLQADAIPAKIQKSELTISEPRRHRDKTHLKFVASQPCLVCGRSPADAHHLRFTQPRAMGPKSATSSRYRCAGLITVTSIASETKSPGGGDGLLIPSRRHGCSGFRRGTSNESQQNSLPR